MAHAIRGSDSNWAVGATHFGRLLGDYDRVDDENNVGGGVFVPLDDLRDGNSCPIMQPHRRRAKESTQDEQRRCFGTNPPHRETRYCPGTGQGLRLSKLPPRCSRAASHTAATAQPLRQVFPANAGLENELDADQRLTIINRWSSGIAKPSRLGRRQQWLDTVPEFIG
jgi:hypothetical protein